MTAGISATNFADLILAALSSGTATLTCTHAQPHTADPGAAGTTSVFTSVGTQRSAITWGSATGTTTRSVASTNGTWSVTGTGTVSHISVWSASSSGSFRFSVALDTPKAVGSGDTLNLTSLSFGLTPIAA